MHPMQGMHPSPYCLPENALNDPISQKNSCTGMHTLHTLHFVHK
jgi:hypothetical protein